MVRIRKARRMSCDGWMLTLFWLQRSRLYRQTGGVNGRWIGSNDILVYKRRQYLGVKSACERTSKVG